MQKWPQVYINLSKCLTETLESMNKFGFLLIVFRTMYIFQIIALQLLI